MLLNARATDVSYQASAPGSLMLLGEYAVLHGKQALVAAIDQRIMVQLTPRRDTTIHIQSTLGEYETTVQAFKIAPPFQFVLSTLHYHLSKLKTGCDISIKSNFSDKMGFGSSAAVTVAMLAVIFAWQNIRLSQREMIKQARLIIRTLQGVGSGADVAASVLGGIVCYQAQPLFLEKMTADLPLTVFYSGSKTATPTAIKYVNEHFAQHPLLCQHIYQAIAQCTQEGIHAIQQRDHKTLGKIMNVQQGLMVALAVTTPRLQAMITAMQADALLLGAKISGSGLGDCVVGLGKMAHPETCLAIAEEVLHLPVNISTQGVKCEKV